MVDDTFDNWFQCPKFTHKLNVLYIDLSSKARLTQLNSSGKLLSPDDDVGLAFSFHLFRSFVKLKISRAYLVYLFPECFLCLCQPASHRGPTVYICPFLPFIRRVYQSPWYLHLPQYSDSYRWSDDQNGGEIFCIIWYHLDEYYHILQWWVDV